jgi:signal transduction histidine kinase
VEEVENLHEQLASLHSISAEIAGLHELAEIHDQALGYCLKLTGSEFAFTGLLRDTDVDVPSGRIKVSDQIMDVAAIKGFDPSPEFYETFHLMILRLSVVGVAIKEDRCYRSNDVDADPHSVGQPPGHPPIRRFLGVPLRLGDTIIGMIGVANKPGGYDFADEQLLSTFAGQVAVAVDNARLYDRQRRAIAELQRLRDRLTEAERIQLLGRERERIAGALHDRIEQEIFMIGVRLTALLDDPSLDRRMTDELRRVRQLSINASDEVRRAIFALSRPEQKGDDLTDRLRSLLAEFERSSGVHAHLFVIGTHRPGFAAIHDVVPLVVEEALTNVKKHADARTVLVSLRYEPDRLDLVIQDDGVGAPETLLRTFQDSYLHFGLRHMRQVVVDRGGTFQVSNGDESGLVVKASFARKQAVHDADHDR